MKLRDKFALSFLEFRYGRAEWVVSVILYTLVFTCILFLGTMGRDMERVVGGVLSHNEEVSFTAQFVGYTDKDEDELKKLGFTDFVVDDDGSLIVAKLKNLDGIWRTKFGALLSDRDIYFMDIESDLTVLLFIKVILYGLCLVLLLLMAGNLSNSFAMKLAAREHYINMIRSLGMSAAECRGIYSRFFGIKNAVALLIAVILNAFCIRGVNMYAKDNFKTASSFAPFKLKLVCLIAILCFVLVKAALIRKWRRL